MITEAKDAGGHFIKQINSALPFKRESAHHAGKHLGADTRAVLKKLGYSDDQIDEFNCF
jgi:alpha-methylacyl-CoA racemase